MAATAKTILDMRDLQRHYQMGSTVVRALDGGPTGDLFSLPWWLLVGAIGFSVLVSLVAGSYPASRAARLDPIRALRHD